jgi:hypothetical protein
MSENSRGAGAIRDEALRIAIDSIFGSCKLLQCGQEIRNSDAGVQQLNKISRADALALGDLQHFNDSAFYKLRIGLSGLFNIIIH